MEKKTVGIVLSVKRQRWLKMNTKSFRTGPLDEALFPHIVKVRYTADGVEYTKRKWIGPGLVCPKAGERVTVIFCTDKPTKFRLAIYGEQL